MLTNPRHVLVHVERVFSVDPTEVKDVAGEILNRLGIPNTVEIDAESLYVKDIFLTVRSMCKRLVVRAPATPDSLSMQLAVTLLRDTAQPQIEVPFIFAITKAPKCGLGLIMMSPENQVMPSGLRDDLLRGIMSDLKGIVTPGEESDKALENYAKFVRGVVGKILLNTMLEAQKRPAGVTLQ